MQEVAAKVQAWHEAGTRSVFARVIDLQGFSTWSGDELVAVNDAGEQQGDILGRYGAEEVGSAAAGLLAAGARSLSRLVIDVHGSRIAEAGLACGGKAELLLQDAHAVPDGLWSAIVGRSPVALLTRIEGPGAGSSGVAVHPDGTWSGGLGTDGRGVPRAELIAAAVQALASGRSSTHSVQEDDGSTVLIEAWVPHPRMVVVGSGELVTAIDRQGRLLGWESRATEEVPALPDLLDWAGASSALVVLSHDPRVDVPVLRAGLDAGVPYIGAMGSHRTQSRRLDRMRAEGVAEEQIARIHRPIGLDLGGRSAAEVALSICAQVLAVRRGREGRALSERKAPINDRPAVHAGAAG